MERRVQPAAVPRRDLPRVVQDALTGEVRPALLHRLGPQQPRRERVTPSSLGFTPLTYLSSSPMYCFVAGCWSASSNGLMYVFTYTCPFDSAVPAFWTNEGSYMLGCSTEYLGT